jgi:hypothetical protein
MEQIDWNEIETKRAAAEANGELDHILPSLRSLAVPMDILLLDPENARDHDPRNIKVIAGSLTGFKQRTTLTANRLTGHIEKGNGTYMSAKLLGWQWIAVAWTEDDEITATAYGLVDNRSSDLSTNNYQQTGKNLRKLKQAEHPMLELMYTDEEAMPLLREDFQAAPLSDEQFDATMLKGRAIRKLTASERLVIDQAIELCRAKSSKALTEGSALEMICKEFLEVSAALAPPVEDDEILLLD